MSQPFFHLQSPIGLIRITVSAFGIQAVDLAVNLNVSETPKPLDAKSPPFATEARELLERYFAGEAVDFTPLPLDLNLGGSAFAQKVWQVLRTVPHGQTRSYAWLGEMSGVKHSARAVGQANRKNPIPLFIPCHRIIRSDGALGGYMGNRGLEIKRFLLNLEGIPV